METLTFRNTFLNLWTWHFYWVNFREIRAPGMHWQELWGSGCLNSNIELISIMESSVSSGSQHHAIFSLWGSAQTSWPVQHSSPVNCKSICLLAGHCVQVQSPPVQGNHSLTCTYRPTSTSSSWEDQGRKVSGAKQTQGSTWWSRLEVRGGATTSSCKSNPWYRMVQEILLELPNLFPLCVNFHHHHGRSTVQEMLVVDAVLWWFSPSFSCEQSFGLMLMQFEYPKILTFWREILNSCYLSLQYMSYPNLVHI